MGRILSAMLLAAALAFAPGCGGDEADVVAMYQHGEKAIAEGNVDELVLMEAPESVARCEEDLRLAYSGTQQEIRRLGPTRVASIVRMRNRIDPEELKGMNYRGFMNWAYEHDEMIVDADYGIFPYSVELQGDVALMQMGIQREYTSSPRFGRRRGGGLVGAAVSLSRALNDVEPIENYVIAFRNIGGSWYYDSIADDEYENAFLEGVAAEAGVHVHDAILAMEEEEFGSIRREIWKPLGK